MQDITLAKAFLQMRMNTLLRALIDWDTLEMYDTALFGHGGKALYADIVYRAKTRDGKEVLLIINHETKMQREVPARYAEYKVGLVRKLVQQKKSPLFIYFMTLYTGNRLSAAYPKNFLDYFEDADMAEKFFFNDDFISLQEYTEEQFVEDTPFNILEVFMRYAQDAGFPEWLINHPEVAERLAEDKHIERSIEYLLAVGHHKEAKLTDAFEKASEKLSKKMLTTKQQIEARGMQQGMKTKAIEIAKNMLLQLQLGIEEVKRVTGLSTKELQGLMKA